MGEIPPEGPVAFPPNRHRRNKHAVVVIFALVALVTLIAAAPAAAAPDGTFTASTLTPDVSQPIALTANTSDTTATEAWSASSGSLSATSGTSVTWTPTTAGTQTVTLLVTDTSSNTAQSSQTITVSPQPVASFNSAPPQPDVGQAVTLTSTSTGTGLSEAWDLGSGTFGDASGPTATWTPTTTGPQTVRLQVTDANGYVDSVPQTITVSPQPVASFTYTPGSPVVGQPMTFTSTATGTGLVQHWDLTGSGSYGDGSGPGISWTPTTTGPHTVGLKVTDAAGETSESWLAFDVAAAPAPAATPVSASFSYTPAAPVVGQPVSLDSTSSGSGLVQRWDLTGTGTFDDASGPHVSWTPSAPGAYAVGLRVTDSRGVTDTTWRTVRVAPAPATSPPLQWLVPFPVVVLSGRIGSRAMTLTRLTVLDAPTGARILVRCRGGGCPHGALTRVVAAGAQAHAVELRKLERRLSAGTVIEIFVTRAGQVGKYTRLSIRAGKAPGRSDSCIMPGASKPSACPR